MAKLFGLSTDEIWARFEQLTERERKLILGVIGFVVIAIVVSGLYWINKNGNERTEKIRTMESQIEEISNIKVSYLDAKKRKDKFENNRTNDLLSYLVSKEDVLGIQSDIGTETPGSVLGLFQQSNIPLALRQSVSIDKLTALLREIEGVNRDGIVKVVSLKVNANSSSPDLLDAAMTVATWNKKR